MTTNYDRLFWKYILLLALTTTFITVQTADDIVFTCDKSGKIQTITKDGINEKQIVIQQDGANYCHYSEPACKKANNKTKLHVIIQADTRPHLFAKGSQEVTHYILECKNDYEVTGRVPVGFTVNPAAKVTPTTVSMFFKPVPPLSLRIVKKGTTTDLNENVNIGEELTLIMGSTGYLVFPKQCTAINGDDPTDEVVIWKHLSVLSNGECSDYDSAITKEKWTKVTNETVSISIYAFQFTTSTKVKINCEAHLCPALLSGCSDSCLDTRRRRRRQIMTGKQQVIRTEEAGVSFEVVSENIFHSNVNQANGVFVNFPVLITAVLFGERLSRFL